jgi:hypothetical protein
MRKLFQFTLRDLFWLVIVAALAINLWLKDQMLKDARAMLSEAAGKLKQAGVNTAP